MNAYTAEPYSDSYSSPAPVLIAGDSDLALHHAARTVEAAGSRIGAVVPLDEAADRIAVQASASAVWVELTRDGGPAMDRLLQQVCSDATDGRYPRSSPRRVSWSTSFSRGSGVRRSSW